MSGSVILVGLVQFRAALHAAWGRAASALSDALAKGGEPVLRRAGEGAPSQFGPSLSVNASGSTAEIRSSLDWGGGAEWGRFGKWQGFVARWGGPPRFAWSALEAEQDRLALAILDDMRDIVGAYGWFH